MYFWLYLYDGLVMGNCEHNSENVGSNLFSRVQKKSKQSATHVLLVISIRWSRSRFFVSVHSLAVTVASGTQLCCTRGRASLWSLRACACVRHAQVLRASKCTWVGGSVTVCTGVGVNKHARARTRAQTHKQCRHLAPPHRHHASAVQVMTARRKETCSHTMV